MNRIIVTTRTDTWGRRLSDNVEMQLRFGEGRTKDRIIGFLGGLTEILVSKGVLTLDELNTLLPEQVSLKEED